METVKLAQVVEEYGREQAAKLVGCHITNINHVIKNDREVYVVRNNKDEVIRCYEVREFPNQKIANAKKQKTSAG